MKSKTNKTGTVKKNTEENILQQRKRLKDALADQPIAPGSPICVRDLGMLANLYATELDKESWEKEARRLDFLVKIILSRRA